jgi:DNA invertase Pin-like site-specific DNA recombinase
MMKNPVENCDWKIKKADVAIYTRHQTGNAEATGVQLCLCHERAAKSNLSVVGTYHDEGSANLDLSLRPGLRALLKDAEAHRFDAVLMEDLDRLSRELVGLSAFLAKFRLLGISVFTRSEEGCAADRLIRRIFREYLEGVTPTEIAKRLNAEAVQ